MPTTLSKADWYRSQIEGHKQDAETASKHGNAARAAFFKREITITKMLLDATLDYGVDFGGCSAAVDRTVAKLKAQEAKLNGIMKSALGPAYYGALQKGRHDVAKASNRRDPVDLAADLVAKLKRAPAEARAAGAAAADNLRKGSQVDRKAQSEAARLRGLLGRAAVLRKSAGWMRLPTAGRLRVVDTVRAARKHLTAIEAKQKARSDAKLAASKNHHAMVARGVTFTTMSQY